MALASSSGAERYANLKRQEGALQRKIIEMEGEADQHKVVVKAIEGMEGSRRCFRLVGGVLVERTVAEVLPAVRENLEAVRAVVLAPPARTMPTLLLCVHFCRLF